LTPARSVIVHRAFRRESRLLMELVLAPGRIEEPRRHAGVFQRSPHERVRRQSVDQPGAAQQRLQAIEMVDRVVQRGPGGVADRVRERPLVVAVKRLQGPGRMPGPVRACPV
jgi:hypothetical protein